MTDPEPVAPVIKLDPAQVASFDQAYAASVDILLNLVASYIRMSHLDHTDGLPEQVTIMALADAVGKEWDHDPIVSALTAAVVMIAEHTDVTE